MNKKELRKLMRERGLKKGEYKVTYEPSADERKVTLEFESLAKMTALDFLLMISDWTHDFATKLYLEAGEKSNAVEFMSDGKEH